MPVPLWRAALKRRLSARNTTAQIARKPLESGPFAKSPRREGRGLFHLAPISDRHLRSSVPLSTFSYQLSTSSSRRNARPLKKRQQLLVHLILQRRAHPVRRSWNHLQHRALHDLRRLQCRRADRYDLVVVSVQNQRRHVELLQILREVRLRKRLDAVVRRLLTA